MKKKNILQKSIILVFFTILLLGAQANAQCISNLRYEGTGELVTSSPTACTIPLSVSNQDIKFTTNPDCTVSAAGITSAIDTSTQINYTLGTPVPVGSVLRVEYQLVSVNKITTLSSTDKITFYLRVVEKVAPIINGVPSSITVNCNLPVPPASGSVSATDNCDNNPKIEYTQTGTASICGSDGILTRTWKATDKSGNTSIKTQTITIVNTSTKPVLVTSASNKQVDCSNWRAELEDWLDINGGSAATDPCSVFGRYSLGGITKTNTEIVSAFNTLMNANSCTANKLASLEVGFYYVNNCGKSSDTTKAVFSAVDNTAPNVLVAPASRTIDCTSDVMVELTSWINNGAGATYSDDCTGISSNSIPNLAAAKDSLIASQNRSCGKTANITVRFYATDLCGNKSVENSATFTVQDNTAPAFQKVPSDKTVICSSTVNDSLNTFINTYGGAIAKDNCEPNIFWTYKWTDSKGNTGLAPSKPIPSLDCIWYANFEFTVSDSCNNANTRSARFTIQDNTAPTFTVFPANITVDCAVIPAVASSITAEDNCSTPTVKFESETNTLSTGCAGSYTITRTWSATDVCGNKSVRTQIITVRDNKAPTISGVPAHVTVSCNNIPLPPASGVVTVTDDCSNNIIPTYIQVSTKGNDPNQCSFLNYVITRTWSATDQCGNMASASQQITVEDRTPPTFNVPSNISVQCYQADNLSITGNYSNLSDNCASNPTIVRNPDVVKGNNICLSDNIIERSWTATDGCNTVTKFQVITMIDTEKPFITNIPSDVTLGCGASLPAVVPIVKDSCDMSVTTATYSQTSITTSCANNYTIVRRWTATDKCGNIRTATQNVTYIDNVAPSFVNCQKDLTVNSAATSCDADFNILAPIVQDNCSQTNIPYIGVQTKPITSNTPGSLTVPVNPVVLNFTKTLTPKESVNNVSLRINLIDVDAENIQEYFTIEGENGEILGKTVNTDDQCSGSITAITTITPEQIYAWANDGVIKITLKPNIPANTIFAINDICGSSIVEAYLRFDVKNFADAQYAYKVDNGTKTSSAFVNNNVNLTLGKHKITQYVNDCSNNIDSCVFNVTVIDKQKPTITAPADETVFLSATDGCELERNIKAPTSIVENCSFGTMYVQKQYANTDSLLRFSYDPNYLVNFANDAVFTFTNVTPSSLSTNGVLQVKLKANASDITYGRYQFVGEDNISLGVTEVSSCSNATITNLSIPSSKINAWAADGIIVITAIRLKGMPIDDANKGIVNCQNLLNNQTDGTSYMTATLSYNTANPTYFVTGVSKTNPTLFYQPNITAKAKFKKGVSKVNFAISDASGNIDTAFYKVTVIDNIAPVAKCKNGLATVNPFTLTSTSLDPAIINDGSTDNCGIASMSVSPSNFTCNDAGTKHTVTLTVRDSSGNTNTCTAQIYIDRASANPTYSLGFCGNDTLELFANPPASSNNDIYTYSWEGPNGFVSTLQNPKIPSAGIAYAGTYQVTITNPLASCTISGAITIAIDPLPNTPIITSNSNKPCSNSELILSTQPYTGKDVVYKWYKGTPSTGTLVDSTTVNALSIFNPKDSARYYVVVSVGNCTSNPSAPIAITPIKIVVATTTNAPVIEVCQGENVTLGATQTGIGYVYQWTGPNGFTASTQYPPVITDAKPLNSGVYTLIITANGCESVPVTTQVSVKPKPITPSIRAIGRDCEGAAVNLVTNATGVTSYNWIRPDFSEVPTQNNTYPISNLTNVSKGEWRVYTIKDGCRSENSPALNLSVNSKPVVTASYLTPVCEGGKLTLNGTAPVGSSYAWTSSAGLVGVTQNITIAAAAGNYTLAAIAPNGCDNSYTVSVTTTAIPVITAISSNTPDCVTGAVDAKLLPTVTPFNDNYTYQWTGPNVTSTDRVLTIPNVTANNNGNYILTVMASSGCSSKPYTFTLGVKNVPVTPIIKGASAVKLCENDDLILELENGYTGTNITYKWMTPAGEYNTDVPSFSIPNVKAFHSGDYSVAVIVDRCESSVSGIKKITVNPIPSRPDIIATTPVCEGDIIRFNTQEIAGATYEWSGPGFSAGIAAPVITNATKANEGIYKVRVIANGCASEYSENQLVVVNETPKQIPSVSNSSPVCMDVSNPTVMLSVDPNSAIPGASYTWFNSSNVNISGAASAQLNYSMGLSAFAKKDTSYEFYVIATLNGCASKASIPTVVKTNAIPNQQAFAGADISVCDATSIILNATKPVIGSGAWTQTEGSSIAIANPTSSNTTVNGLVSGQNYTLQWRLSNGACKDYAFDEMKINVGNTNIKADAGDSINICAKTTTQLNAQTLPNGITGTWTQLISQEQIGVKILDPTNPKTTVTGLTPGNKYIFKWTLSNTACKDYSTDEVYVLVAAPQGVAQVESDKRTCGTTTTLSAVNVAGAIGTWTSLGSAEIASPNANNTSAKNLIIGQNQFVWTLSNATCGVYSSDTLTVTTEQAAIAKDDNITIAYAANTTIEVLKNDVLPSNGFTMKIVSSPKHGSASVSGNGTTIDYKAESGYTGADEIEYQLCNNACPDICSNAKVSITISGGGDCTVPTVITPNGDLTNDRWEIPCLTNPQYANNTVIVFNQWGDEVFRANKYKNDWEGTYNGKNLPDATYFFIVDFGNGEKQTGFLIIER